MRIRVGYELVYECPQSTPMLLTLNTHFSRAADIVVPDHIVTSPSVPITPYRDEFGNWCSRIVAPTGEIRISTDAVVNDSGLPEPTLSLLPFSTGFSHALISGASRAIAPMMRPPSARSISAACLLSGRSPCSNSAKAWENVASEGTCALRSQPRIRRNHLADTRSARDGASRAFELATTNFKHASDLGPIN